MFKNVYTLAILTHLVYIVGATTNATQQCNDNCGIVCGSCQTSISCKEEEIDCGLDDPDPTFASLCSLPERICVAKNCTCKYIIIVMKSIWNPLLSEYLKCFKHMPYYIDRPSKRLNRSHVSGDM